MKNKHSLRNYRKPRSVCKVAKSAGSKGVKLNWRNMIKFLILNTFKD